MSQLADNVTPRHRTCHLATDLGSRRYQLPGCGSGPQSARPPHTHGNQTAAFTPVCTEQYKTCHIASAHSAARRRCQRGALREFPAHLLGRDGRGLSHRSDYRAGERRAIRSVDPPSGPTRRLHTGGLRGCCRARPGHRRVGHADFRRSRLMASQRINDASRDLTPSLRVSRDRPEQCTPLVGNGASSSSQCLLCSSRVTWGATAARNQRLRCRSGRDCPLEGNAFLGR